MNERSTMRWSKGLLVAGSALALAACTLTLDLDDECTADGDCQAGQSCVENLCVGAVSIDDGVGGVGGNAGMGGMGGMGGDTGVDPMERPEQCRNNYAVSAEDIMNDDVVRVGMLMPTTGDLGPVGLAIEQAAALAAEEINQNGGIDGSSIGIIACDTATDPDQAQAMAQWLIQSAGVPAIIGPATSTNTLAVFQNIAFPGGALLISPSATSPAITDLSDDDLMWRTVPSDAIQGRAILGHLDDRGYQKIAMVYLNDAYGQGLLNAVQRPLCETDRCGEETFLALGYDADDEGNVEVDQVNTILGRLQGFEPDVLVLVGFVKAGTRILNSAALSGFDDIPIVLTDGMQNAEIIANIDNQDLLRNVIGTAPASPEGTVFQTFRNRYSGRWGVEPAVYNAQAYDAMYLLGFAMAAAEAPVTGAGLAANLKRMSAGEEVLAAGDQWNRGVRILRESADATFDFQGASGPLNFDNDRGEAAADIEGWYLDLDQGTVESLGVIYTGTGEFRPFQSPNEDPPKEPPPE